MELLSTLLLLNPLILVVHVICAVIAVGAVSVVDYLHLVSMRKKKIEKELVDIYPLLSNLINLALIFLYITGALLLINKPSLLQSGLFLTKLSLVLIVTINGLFLRKKVSPDLNKCVIQGTKSCTTGVLHASVFGGTLSIVTWYAILILALTKKLGYTVTQFLSAYFIALIIVGTIAYFVEKRSRKWRKE